MTDENVSRLEAPALPAAKRLQLPAFFLLTLIVSWAIWVPLALAKVNGSGTASAAGSPVNLLAVWGPGIAAIVLSLAAGGGRAVRALFRPIRLWRVGPIWYLFALLYPAAVKLAAYGVDRALGRDYTLTFLPLAHFFTPQQAAIMVPAAFISAIPNTLGEELGWRGFALPRLQRSFGALVAAILLGIFWGVWHVPMWMMTSGTFGAHEIAALAGIVGASILFAWLYNGTGGSLLLAWLFHFSMTSTGYAISAAPTWTDEILGWLVVAAVVAVAGPRQLSRKGERHVA